METIQHNQERFIIHKLFLKIETHINLFEFRQNLFEFRQDMFKIPLKPVKMTAFPDHGWRFGRAITAFYITIDDTNAIYAPCD